MRGADEQQSQIFSYLSPEARVRKDHPLRAIRVMVDEVLARLSRQFDAMYASVGRPSIAPEKLLRAQLDSEGLAVWAERCKSNGFGAVHIWMPFVDVQENESVSDSIES
jgi:hypothetical protein